MASTIHAPHAQSSGARVTFPLLWFGMLAALLVVLFTPILQNVVNYEIDYQAHLRFIAVWEANGSLEQPLPHFLFHITVMNVHRLLPSLTLEHISVLVSATCYVLLGLSIYSAITHYGALRSPPLAILSTMILMLVGPINLLTAGNHNLYLGYLSPHIYHNPTITFLKPFALWSFLFAVQVFNTTPVNRRTIFICALVTTFGTLAKPNYMIALLPTLALLAALAVVRRHNINWLLLLAGIVLPAAIVLVWQRNYYQVANMGSFILAPLQVMGAYSPGSLLPKFLLSILFPLCVAFLYIRTAAQDRMLQIGWIGFAVGAFFTYFIAESRSYLDGNFTWSGQITLFILFVASTLFFIRQNAALLARRRFTPAFLICTLVLLLHVIGGLLLYRTNLGSDWQSWM